MSENSIFMKFEAERRILITKVLSQPVLGRLATANPETCQPHVVPLWYIWDGEYVWVSGFCSTRKFKELIANPNFAILIEPVDPKESKLQAVLLEGQAQVITDDQEIIKQVSTQIYNHYLGEEGAQESEPQSWIHDPENLVVKLKPLKVFAW